MNKYQYYVNDKPVSKKELVKRLRECCYRVADTIQVGLIGIDMVEVDEKEFNRCLRHICDPSYACVIIDQTSFSRKKI